MPNVVNVSPTETHQMIRARAMFLDVRDQNEWDAGHATDAVFIPLEE